MGRIAMLLVLGALLYLYLSAGISYLSTWREAKSRDAAITTMERQNASLEAERIALGRPGTVEAEARRLGMVHPGERAYIVTGLPPN
jgi:cell division protein FtsB